MNLTGRPIYAKGRTPKKAPKPMRKVSVKKAQHQSDPSGMFVSKVLRDFARGRECQMKSDWCNNDPETVVLCHSRRRAGAGMGQKPHDFWAYHGCAECHSNEHLVEDRELYDAIRRTQWIVFEKFGSLTP